MADRRDYVALEWVKGEIEETLKQAQYALEAFVEAPDDTTRLQFSLAYLHQVHGTLQMVEFYGAALLAEEMELLNQAIVDGKVPGNTDNLAVLMQAIIQLPSYLDRIKQGQHDLPIVILPLLNDLRAARGESLLSETSLFSPDLAAARRFIGEPDYSAFSQTKTTQLLAKLRQMYQLALLGWLKKQNESESLDFMAKAVARIVKLTERTHSGSYWRVVDAFVAALKNGLVERSPATVKILRDTDQAFRALLKEPLVVVRAFASDQQFKNLLFYLAKIGETGIDRITHLQRQYRLTESLPSEQDVAEQRAKLSGPDRDAVNNVVSALLEELARLKDALDMMVRTQVRDPQRLAELIPPFQQLTDTMSVAGLNNPRRVLGEQLEIIRQVHQGSDIVDDGLLMDIAGALLYVEATLTGIVSDANKDLSSDEGNAEVDSANDAVLREARTGIEQVKDAIVEYIGSHFDASHLESTSKLLSGVRGGLLMIPLNNASRVLHAIEKYIDTALVTEKYRPQWHEMDLLADALVGVEYYLERLTRDGNETNLDILARAADSLEQLGLTVIVIGDESTQSATDDALDANDFVDDFALEETLPADTVAPPEPSIPVIEEQAPAPNAFTEPEIVEFEAVVVDDTELDEPLVGGMSKDMDASADAVDGSEVAGEAIIDWGTDDGGSINADTLDFLESPAGDDEDWSDLPVVDFDGEEFEASLVETDSLTTIDLGAEPPVLELAPGNEPLLEPELGSESELETEAALEPGLEIESELEPELGTEAALEPGLEIESEPELELGTEAALESGLEIESELGTGFEIDSEFATESELEPDLNFESEFEFDSEFEIEDEFSSEPEFIPELNVEVDFDPITNVEPEPESKPTTEPVLEPAAQPSEATVEASSEQLTSAEPPVVVAEQADDDLIDEEILEIFIEEAAEVLEAINEFYPQYRADENNSSALTEFRRAYHTMKGSGRMVGATVVGETAWAIENMLNRLIDGSIARSDDLLRAVEEVTAELPMLVKAFEEKRKPDTNRADALAEIAHAISKGLAVDWSLVDQGPAEQASQEDASEAVLKEVFEPSGQQDEVESESNENLLKIFKTELQSHLEFVENYIQDSPLGNKLPDALQRALHTIKGSAHMASMEIIAEPVTPVEVIVRTMQERGRVAEAEFLLLLQELVLIIKAYGDSEPGIAVTEEVLDFIERVRQFPVGELQSVQLTSQEDASLMTIFLSESMDIVLDAESLIDQWKGAGNSAEVSTTLIRELDTLAQAAQSVDLIPLSQLSNELKSLYVAAEDNSFLVDDRFFALAQDGHESLISMMDRLAAGQSIRTDALFSERLQQLFTVNSIPFSVKVAEQPQPASEAPLAAQMQPPVIEQPALPTEAAERYHVEGDPELVEIFLEEANDILDGIQRSLDIWISDTHNTREVEGLQRDLHTLKGGARMAEISPLGDLAHELEFLYEGLAQSQYDASEGLIQLLQQCHDRLAVMIGDIESSMSCESAPDLVVAISSFRGNPGEPPKPVELKAVVEPPVAEPEPSSIEPEQEVNEVEISVPLAEDTTSATEEPAVAPTRVDVPPLPKDVDLDILEIFIDEAGELLNELETAVEEWRAEPENAVHADEMKRVLHTLKGGARLARLQMLGDATHDFESFIIKVQHNRLPLDEAFFSEILNQQDQLVNSIELLQQQLAQQGSEGGFGPSVIQLASEMDDEELEKITESDDSSGPRLELVSNPKPEQTASEDDTGSNVLPFKTKASPDDAKAENKGQSARRAQPQETVKVSANLLEGLVNLAGETSISRSRLEQEVSDFGFTLTDMDQTIDRLRDHVRRLDMETEAQILFRQERAEETNYEDFDPLEMDRYSQIQQLSRSLMETAYDLQDLKSTLVDKTRDAETLLLQQSRINTELQEGLMRTRMVPFSRLLPRLRRIVRQVAGELAKQVDFVIGNAEGEVDRTVLERMISPLEHLLRNAVDHGIEAPDVRHLLKKPETGTIRLDLSREGSDIVLRLEDDGKGLDVHRIRQRAIERGLMSADADLNETEIMQFILEAGFSTAEKVTQISGRGVGMDVVNSEVKQLGGSIVIESEQGRGTLFTIRLPFTVSVNRALMVNILDDLYALPLTSIEGIVRVTPKQLAEYYQPDAPLFEYGGSRYRLEYMSALLHTSARPNVSAIEQSVPLVLVRGTDDRHSMALHVDRLMGSREIVVKSLGMHFSKVPGVSGATILGDGSVVVILDLSALIRSELAIEPSVAPLVIEHAPEPEVRQKDGPSKVMVCDDSVTVRKVTSRLLERNGMEVMLAKHGADAIAQMIDEIPDLILLDIEMPHMDGFEVASRVRHDERLKHIPIIMITSRTGSKHRERALSIGVNEYLGKPFQEGPLLQTIERLLAEIS